MVDSISISGDPVTRKTLEILKKAPVDFLERDFTKIAPIVVYFESTGHSIGRLMEGRILAERSSERGVMDRLRGRAALSDLLAYLMDLSLNSSLDGNAEAIYRWLLFRIGVSREEVRLGIEQENYLTLLRRRLLGYQLDYLIRRGFLTL